MIWDAGAGRPHPAASPRVDDVNCRHRRRCRPPHPHRATTKTGFLPAVAALAIAAVSAVVLVAPVYLVVASAAADAVSPRSQSSHRRRRPLRNRRLPRPPKPEQRTLLGLGPRIHGNGAHLRCHPHAAPGVVVVAFVFLFVVIFAIIVPPSARNPRHRGRSCRSPQPPSAAATRT